MSVEEYAVKLFEKWGIGKKGTDNGLLILVSKNDREYKIETGYGLEGTITDARASRIGRNILEPNFKREEYGNGLYEAVLEIKGLVEKEPNIEQIVNRDLEVIYQIQYPDIIMLILSLLIAIICNYSLHNINDILPINTMKGELDTEEEYEKIIEKSNEIKKYNRNNKTKRLGLVLVYLTRGVKG